MSESRYIIYDRAVEGFAASIADGSPMYGLDADEEHKTIDTVMDICRWLLEMGADRNALLLAVGGGITTDMVGFAASIYKRGVRYASYPTTLLSMVDASIGGKTGVNLDGYKNMLGCFRMPESVEIRPEVLATLPFDQLLSGFAEMLKTFIIDNTSDNYHKALDAFRSAPNWESLLPFISPAADIKRRIVEKDPFENDIRRFLNLGHTYGHAVEWWQKKTGLCSYSHGEAVAIGIAISARISEKLGYCSKGLASRISDDLASCGLPVELPCPESELSQALLKDKKALDGKINFVLIKSIGEVCVEPLSPDTICLSI